MPRRRITRTPTKKMGTMVLRDTDLLLLQCSISLHPTPLETLAFLQLLTRFARFELYCWILIALALEPLQIVWTISFLLIQQICLFFSFVMKVF
ncbi:hypothetical protein Bca4012_101436 [Brassica carinata]